MSDLYPWDEQEKRTRVDCAGCLNGEIDRPANMYAYRNFNGDQICELQDPDKSKAFIRTDTPIDTEANR